MDFDTFVIQLCVMSGKQANKPEIDNGGKCILPQYVFQEISARRTPYPLMFELFFPHNGKTTHVGVLEFTAAEGTAILPEWVMEKFHARRLAHVQFRTVSLPMGNFLRIRPMQKAFIDLTDPKTVLQNHLQRSFVCLTTNDTFTINYAGQVFKIHVMEVRSRAAGKCAAIKMASENMDEYRELIVEFERPADMPASPNRASATAFPTVGGGGTSNQNPPGIIDFDKQQEKPSTFVVGGIAPGVGGNTNPTFVDNTGKKFETFSGSGQSISGKKPTTNTTGTTTGSSQSLGSSGSVSLGSNSNNNNPDDLSKAMAAARAARIGRTISGKTVTIDPAEEEKKKKEAAEKEEAERKQKEQEHAAPFSGAGRTLGGRPVALPKNHQDAAESTTNQQQQQQDKHAPIIGRTLRGKTVPLVPNPDSSDSSPENIGSPVTPGLNKGQTREPQDSAHHTNNKAGANPHQSAFAGSAVDTSKSNQDDDKKFHPFGGGGRKLAS